MAQFQKGGPDGLEHAIGIVHGYVGAWGYEAMYVLSLADVDEATKQMGISQRRKAKIRATAQRAGLLDNAEEIQTKIMLIGLPKDFCPNWTLRFTTDDEGEQISVLSDKRGGVELYGDPNDFFPAFEVCDRMFREGSMTAEEAVNILQGIIKNIMLKEATIECAEEEERTDLVS